METVEKTTIRIEATINAPLEKVWQCFNQPEHVVKWNQASDDWHSPSAENDLREGGRFNYRMEAKDGSAAFDFSGTYTRVEPNRVIEYNLDDNRKVTINMEGINGETKLVELFEAEPTHSIEQQRDGWQAILNNFKKYVESQDKPKKLYFEILIDADIEKVYRIMIDKQTYSAWTSAFNPASRFEGSWEPGSKILFIGEDDKGNKGGMVSSIRENIPNKYISIEHLGLLNGDEEITSGPEVEKWAGSLENYSFIRQDGKTLVKVDLDVNDEYEGYFDETWPLALEKLKKLCEGQAVI